MLISSSSPAKQVIFIPSRFSSSFREVISASCPVSSSQLSIIFLVPSPARLSPSELYKNLSLNSSKGFSSITLTFSLISCCICSRSTSVLVSESPFILPKMPKSPYFKRVSTLYSFTLDINTTVSTCPVLGNISSRQTDVFCAIHPDCFLFYLNRKAYSHFSNL